MQAEILTLSDVEAKKREKYLPKVTLLDTGYMFKGMEIFLRGCNDHSINRVALVSFRGSLKGMTQREVHGLHSTGKVRTA